MNLLDIGPLSEEIKVHGNSLTVSGISAGDLFYLFGKYPDIKLIFGGLDTLTSEQILSLGPVVVAEGIACACGLGGNSEAIKIASHLPVSVQVDCLNAIFRLTFPDGPDPFAMALEALIKTLGLEHRPADTGPAKTSSDRVSAALVMGDQKPLPSRRPRANSPRGSQPSNLNEAPISQT